MALPLVLIATRPEMARAQAGFPCAAYEWVEATWRPPQKAECHSCYECAVGQVCVQRGGCFNCTAGEYDADGDPTHLCVPSSEGFDGRLDACVFGLIYRSNQTYRSRDLVFSVHCSSLLRACVCFVCWV